MPRPSFSSVRPSAISASMAASRSASVSKRPLPCASRSSSVRHVRAFEKRGAARLAPRTGGSVRPSRRPAESGGRRTSAIGAGRAACRARRARRNERRRSANREAGRADRPRGPGVTKPVTVESQKTFACERVCDCTSNTPLACIARSSGHVTNAGDGRAGSRPRIARLWSAASAAASVMRAGIANRIARRSVCRSSGVATVHALAQASSKVSATRFGPGSTPSMTSRAISSHVTVR